jgi:hypothetical protein
MGGTYSIGAKNMTIKHKYKMPFRIVDGLFLVAADNELIFKFDAGDGVLAEFVKTACNSHYELLGALCAVMEPFQRISDENLLLLCHRAARKAIQNATK